MDGSAVGKGPRLTPAALRSSKGVDEGSADSTTVDVDLKPRPTALKASVRRGGTRRPSEDYIDRYYPNFEECLSNGA